MLKQVQYSNTHLLAKLSLGKLCSKVQCVCDLGAFLGCELPYKPVIFVLLLSCLSFKIKSTFNMK